MDYETTARNAPFKGTEVSRNGLSPLAADLVRHPQRLVRANVGMSKPNTEGDKPAFV